jgi:flagellin FlaB
MKSNQKFLMDNERGDIGVGTLIIFIAMVLVAAVAATVLIYTTGALQQKATKTSKEATQQISSNIVVEQVIGDRIDPAINANIQNIIIRIKPDVGTTSIDLRQVIISVQDKTQRIDIYHEDVTSPLAILKYTAIAIRDEDESFLDVPVFNSGDLIEITLDQVALDTMTIDPRKTIFLSLNQERGQAVNLEIATPNSFGVNRYVPLYP